MKPDSQMSSLSIVTEHPPHLVHALNALARRSNAQPARDELLHELSGITVLVAQKFTNDRTAEGLSAAFHLSVGCISLGLALAELEGDEESVLRFLLQHGAERVFQMGFRHIKELAALPYCAILSEFDRDPAVQKINLKALFSEICWADPRAAWEGDALYRREYRERMAHQQVIQCALWLRKNHYAGAIKDADMDAHAVIALAVVFAIQNGAYIVARSGQKDIETLIRNVRANTPDIDANWTRFLNQIPTDYHPILQERWLVYRGSIIKKIQSKAALKKVLSEIQDHYAANELEVEYP